MPVRKFRSVEEMSRPQWREPGDPELHRTIARLWAFGRQTSRRRFPPGVYLNRTIEEMNARADAWRRAK